MTQPLDTKDFRRALGQFPTGVTVVTAIDGARQPVGVTASSFNSVSMEPPLIVWSVDRMAFSAPIFENAEFFAVNILGKDQVNLANRFAGRGKDKFGGISTEAGVGGCALLEDCAARLQCKTWNVFDGGDHLMIVGEVIDFEHDELIQPLVFSRSSYAVPTLHPSSMSHDSVDLGEDGFLSDYLPYLLFMTYVNSSARLYPQLQAEFDVTPEEWRVLTLLVDYGPLTANQLAQKVVQPESLFEATAAQMVDKGFIQHADAGRVTLSESGKALARRMIAIAKEHEEIVLSVLPQADAASLKESLKTIARHSV